MSAKTKHTPGPWVAGYGDRFPRHELEIRPAPGAQGWSVGFAPIARVVGDARITTQEQRLADARLIAASPKMYEALRYYRDECSGREPSLSVFHAMLDDALSQAEG